ncbi:MAG: RelA/SpoT family protein [Bacteroidales bacterium]|nr:RelA/SpoT family protein [Bacteroidales bacterium]
MDYESERKEILQQYRELISAAVPKTTEEDQQQIKKAFQIAAEAHKDMRRKSGEPYIIHPIEVARIAVEEIGLGATSIICALLHDVVEDTDYTLKDIEELFNPTIARIIDGLTKISGIFDNSDQSHQAENFRKVLLTLSDDVRVILIKLADRLHNMRTLDSLPERKQFKIASETTYLYAPLAHRLGLYAIKSDLEDHALKYTHPEIYETIVTKLRESELERKRFINSFIFPIKKALNQEGLSYKIIHRTKSINSIWKKMKKKEIPFEEVYDLFAIRIVITTPVDQEKQDCWRVYSLVTDFYRPKMDRLRDWISIPKANGYESLHTTVMSSEGKWVEIQIRSQRMDDIAERGFAAHWKYKGDGNVNDLGLDNWLSRIREWLQNPESDALDFLDDFKLNLFSDEIYVFTPKGEIKTLPVNATTLDFAYTIHSQIGNTAIGAKINYKLEPLNKALHSGDQVEIITSRKQKPKEEWYEWVTTARAKTQIKLAIKENRKKYTEPGKRALKQYFRNLKIEYNDANIKALMNYVQTPSEVDFLYKLAIGDIDLENVKAFSMSYKKGNWLRLIKKQFTRKNKTSSSSLYEDIRRKLESKPEQLLLGQDIGKMNYVLAECCNPIPGDDVIGFIKPNKGLEVHRTNCPVAIERMSTFGNSAVKAKWKETPTVEFLTGIKINGIDKVGLVNDITKIISEELSVNIRSLEIKSHDGLSEGIIMLYLSNTYNLKNLITKLQRVEGVQKVQRIKKTDTLK